jgi:hypothetical protein
MAKEKRERYTKHQSTISGALSDAFSALEELGGEMRERFDNAPENLQQTDTNQRVSECADVLEGLSEPTCPDCIAEVAMEYRTENKRRASRADRRDEAVGILNDVIGACDTWLEENKGTDDLTFDDIPAGKLPALRTQCGVEEDVDPTDDQRGEMLDAYTSDLTIDDERGEVEEFQQEVQGLIDEAEGAEFPGMYG